MFIHTIIFLARGDIMNKMKDVALIAAGSMMTLAYQKYKKPMLKTLQKAMNKEKKMANDMLEDMM